MKRILVVFDSCRYDTYIQADTSLIDKIIGLPIKAETKSICTISAWFDFIGSNRLPKPVGKDLIFPEEFNYIKKIHEEGVKIHLLTDNPYLTQHPGTFGFKQYFETWEVFGKYYCNQCRNIIKRADELELVDNYYLILWFGETHLPYITEYVKPDGWDEFMKKLTDYNSGADCVDLEYLEYLKKKQSEACEWLCKHLAPFIENHLDAEIILTADHGECFGEGHKYGHNFPDPILFEVPIVIYRPN